MIQGLFRWLSIATLFLFLGNSLNAQVYSLDTVHLSKRDRIPIPEVSGGPIIYTPSHCVVPKHQGIKLGQVIGLTLITRHPTTS